MKSSAEKIIYNLFSNLQLDKYGLDSSQGQYEVLKEEFKKSEQGKPFYLIQNFKGENKISHSNKFGKVILDWEEIIKIAKCEISKDKPDLFTLRMSLNDRLFILY